MEYLWGIHNENDTISIHLDLKRKEIKFFHGEQDLGIAYQGGEIKIVMILNID